MLEALELFGFKSFAEKTAFRFGPGITAVVGPNGSGKSNVVDSIKWVLGSQSPKGLRGKEMTDVIFGGSGGRQPAGAAEVTMVFDNRNGVLPIDAPKVRVTRRVYRSGEGEYFLNGQPSRLRELRDLFAGSGVSSGAYSIIEQGRVDALLQSSPRDRRLLFEEAAGISRYKTKRQEADRRMQRVKQDLLRLGDAVGGLRSRLKSVRSQAGKAKTYREVSQKLQGLRVRAAASDRRTMLSEIDELTRQRDTTATHTDEAEAEVNRLRGLLAQVEQEAQHLHDTMQQASGRSTHIREEIAAARSSRADRFRRCGELHKNIDTLAVESLTLRARMEDSRQRLDANRLHLQEAERELAETRSKLADNEQQLTRAEEKQTHLRAQVKDCRDRGVRLAARIESLTTELQTLAEQRATLANTADAERAKAETIGAELSGSQATFREADSQSQTLQRRCEQLSQLCDTLRKRLASGREQAAKFRQEADALRATLAEADQRAAVLDELERRVDGLSDGAKKLVLEARETDEANGGAILGVLADLLRVDADTAHLVELALGEYANHLVVRSGQAVAALLARTELPGRVAFLRLDVPRTTTVIDRVDLSAEEGVMGRADQFVQARDELAELARRLLGRWWFVDSLATALALSAGIGRGLSFVTLTGEVVAADGRLIAGPRETAAGILSRRSELRALREESEKLRTQLQQREDGTAKLADSLRQWEADLDRALVDLAGAQGEASEAAIAAATARAGLDQVRKRAEEANSALAATESKLAAAVRGIDDKETEFERVSAEAEQAATVVAAGEAELPGLDAALARLRKEATDARVQLARSEQLRDSLHAQSDQLATEHAERTRALAETDRRTNSAREQSTAIERELLRQGQLLADLFLEKDGLEQSVRAAEGRLARVRQAQTSAVEDVDAQRERSEQCRRRLQAIEMRLQQKQADLAALLKQLREDHGIGVELLDDSAEPLSAQEREQIELSIKSLRAQLQEIGPVNMEALAELESLEERHAQLAGRLDDLSGAETRLRQLIGRINVDSRKVFTETIDTARGHFKELFTRLFNGGEADILVDVGEEGDVLECGIEIVAKPPGKKPRSISLLSGGERTMTCVALLLAIFKSRPSPFCILDEVDAALDEANIDRFVRVLKEFMSSTQFVVITHSKRTMSCADALYGITMQESGISKRVAVRFDTATGPGASGAGKKAAA